MGFHISIINVITRIPSVIYNNDSQDISYSLMVFSSGMYSRIRIEMLRGGKLKGQGTYGCVFQPALLCRGETEKRDKSMVGKITSTLDAKNEIQISEYLHDLEDFDTYTLPVELDKCIPRSLSRQEEEDINKCNFTQGVPLEKSIQLLMPWGGVPLYSINLRPNAFDYFKFTEELLAIGAFLVLNDICHFDLHGANLLFNRKNTPKLIDFGFAFQPSKLTLNTVNSRWRQINVSHNTETPEVTLMIASLDNIPPIEIIRGLQLEKPAVQHLAVYCGVLPSLWGADLLEWIQISQSFQEQDWLNSWKLYWPGFDAWGIGALLLDVLEFQMSFPSFGKSKKWQEHGEITKTVLRGMCCGNPAKRMDAVEALYIFTNGTHPLISAGSVGEEWVKEKKAMRPPL